MMTNHYAEGLPVDGDGRQLLAGQHSRLAPILMCAPQPLPRTNRDTPLLHPPLRHPSSVRIPARGFEAVEHGAHGFDQRRITGWCGPFGERLLVKNRYGPEKLCSAAMSVETYVQMCILITA